MLNLLENYNKPVRVNGKVFENGKIAYAAHLKYDGDVEVELNWVEEKLHPQPQETPQQLYKVDEPSAPTMIKVRQYMTKPSTPQFDFHKKMNDDKPMPLREMEIVEKLGETKGMVKLKLKGKPMPTKTCMRCGRKLTHPVSMNYGIGPECGGHFWIGPEMDIEAVREKMESIEWTGWVIKSAIERKWEVHAV